MLRRFIAALSVFMALAWHVPASAQTALQAPSIKWQGQWGTTQPVSFIGYDTGTGLPCIVGSSATCVPPGPAASPTGGANTYLAFGGTTNALLTASPVPVGAPGPHSLYSGEFANTNAADVFCQAFDATSGSVTLGTTVPRYIWRLPGGGTATNAAFWDTKIVGAVAFSNAITIACTTTATGSTAPATGVSGVLVYQ